MGAAHLSRSPRAAAATCSTRWSSSARDPDPAARELAAYVLGQLGWDERAFPHEQEAALRAMAAREQDPEVVAGIAYAFGHLGAPAGQDWVLGLRGHPDADVREAVAFALGGRSGEARARRADRALGRRGAAVRDWATFALGTLAEDDGQALRDALVARLEDPDEDTRLEAVHGLAVRGDPRAAAAGARTARRARRRASDSVWTRHLLAETASHLDGTDARLNDAGRRKRRPGSDRAKRCRLQGRGGRGVRGRRGPERLLRGSRSLGGRGGRSRGGRRSLGRRGGSRRRRRAPGPRRREPARAPRSGRGRLEPWAPRP